MFDTEMEAARAYDTAVWRLKPCEARNYANFKDTCPADVAEALKAAEKVCRGQCRGPTLHTCKWPSLLQLLQQSVRQCPTLYYTVCLPPVKQHQMMVAPACGRRANPVAL